MTDKVYPGRPPYFACDYVRLLGFEQIANDLGPQACWLLTVVVMVEDQLRYSRSVTFSNEQLVRMAGSGSVSSLDRARKRCVEAGWLHYVPGGRRVGPGVYWVTVPKEYQGYLKMSLPTGGLLRTSDNQTGTKPEVCAALVTTKPGANREQTDEQTGILLTSTTSSPLPQIQTPLAGAGESSNPATKKAATKKKSDPEADPLFLRLYSAYPRKKKRPDAAKAFADARAAGHITEANIDEIISQIERLKASPGWLEEKGRYIPYPATWIRAREWEDPTPTPTSTTDATKRPTGARSDDTGRGHLVPAQPGEHAPHADGDPDSGVSVLDFRTKRSDSVGPTEPPKGKRGSESAAA